MQHPGTTFHANEWNYKHVVMPVDDKSEPHCESDFVAVTFSKANGWVCMCVSIYVN